MAFFSKKTEEENTPPRNPSNVVMFRVLAIGYVGYLCVQMIKTYLAGGSDAPSLPMLIGGVAVLGAGAIFLAVLTYKEYKRNKVAYDEAMAVIKAEAKAAREAEEAREAALKAEDEYYEALEAAQAEAEAEEETEE